MFEYRKTKIQFLAKFLKTLLPGISHLTIASQVASSQRSRRLFHQPERTDQEESSPIGKPTTRHGTTRHDTTAVAGKRSDRAKKGKAKDIYGHRPTTCQA